MHILETYALNCGSKIKRPYIYTTFFPIPFENFITINCDETEQAKSYDYWQDVVNILNPILAQFNIKIVQLGDVKGSELSDCVSFRGQASANQTAYILQRSMLHIGADGFSLQLAGAFDIPLVGLYSSGYAGCTRPYFSSPIRQRLFEAYKRTTLKPSHSSEEMPKSINLIKPEEIASAVLELLGIHFPIPFETVFTGKKYSHQIIEETIPDSPHILFNPEHQVEMRADLAYNEDGFINQLAQFKRIILVVDKPVVNMNALFHFKDHIHSIVFKITGEDQREFLSKLVALGRNMILISTLSEERIQELRALYYEFGNINRIELVSEDKINELKKDIDSLYYRTAKITSSQGKYFYSFAAAELGAPMQNHHEYQKVIDSPAFWENLNCFTIVKRK